MDRLAGEEVQAYLAVLVFVVDHAQWIADANFQTGFLAAFAGRGLGGRFFRKNLPAGELPVTGQHGCGGALPNQYPPFVTHHGDGNLRNLRGAHQPFPWDS